MEYIYEHEITIKLNCCTDKKSDLKRSDIEQLIKDFSDKLDGSLNESDIEIESIKEEI